MLVTYITCFAIYLGTQQCINFYFRGNISSFMTENNSSRFFWTPATYPIAGVPTRLQANVSMQPTRLHTYIPCIKDHAFKRRFSKIFSQMNAVSHVKYCFVVFRVDESTNAYTHTSICTHLKRNKKQKSNNLGVSSGAFRPPTNSAKGRRRTSNAKRKRHMICCILQSLKNRFWKYYHHVELLNLAGTRHFAILHGTKGGGGVM